MNYKRKKPNKRVRKLGECNHCPNPIECYRANQWGGCLYKKWLKYKGSKI